MTASIPPLPSRHTSFDKPHMGIVGTDKGVVCRSCSRTCADTGCRFPSAFRGQGHYHIVEGYLLPPVTFQDAATTTWRRFRFSCSLAVVGVHGLVLLAPSRFVVYYC